MCFHVLYNMRNPFKLSTHTLCWKVLHTPHDYGGHAPYKGTYYAFGKLYSAVITPHNGIIDIGLHSYHSNRGFNCFPALIPAGTQFYFNDWDQELVSEALVVFRNLDELLLAAGANYIHPAIRLPRST
jgi:hypothetical protein